MSDELRLTEDEALTKMLQMVEFDDEARVLLDAHVRVAAVSFTDWLPLFEAVRRSGLLEAARLVEEWKQTFNEDDRCWAVEEYDRIAHDLRGEAER